MPPASPVAFITRVNCGTFASNVGMHMKIFMLDWPPRTARADLVDDRRRWA